MSTAWHRCSASRSAPGPVDGKAAAGLDHAPDQLGLPDLFLHDVTQPPSRRDPGDDEPVDIRAVHGATMQRAPWGRFSLPFTVPGSTAWTRRLLCERHNR